MKISAYENIGIDEDRYMRISVYENIGMGEYLYMIESVYNIPVYERTDV